MGFSASERWDGRTANVTVPAEPRSVEVACTAVGAALAGSGCGDGCERDLHLAADELASILVVSARERSQLHLEVTDDGADVYIRMMVTVCATAFPPQVTDLSRMLLDATVDSYEIRIDGDELVGILQRTFDGDRTD